SPHVGREVERAASKQRHIITFRIDAGSLNPALEYFLGESQWIDVPKLGMSAALAKLAEAVGSRSDTSVRDNRLMHRGGGKLWRFTIFAAILLCLVAAATVALRL